MNAFAQIINALGVARLATLLVVGVATLAVFYFIVLRVSGPNMALLYGDLNVEDSSQIIAKLDAMGEPYRIGGNGAQIFVDGDKALRLRMSMAEAGLPSGGSVGYEIFDRSSGIGSSNFVQNVNRLRALEGELGRTIRSMSLVAAARVHLVLPQRELFSRQTQEPSASIVLQLRGSGQLQRGQVLAIQSLVAAAVPGLQPQRVSIVDTRGNLLARTSSDGEATDVSAANSDEMRQAYEHRLSRKIEELLEQSLGPGTVRAQVSADMDFDRISTSEEIYDPDSQVARSTQTVEESNASKDGEKNSAAVSVAQELPPPEAPENPSVTNSANSTRTEETVNYEISKVVKSHVREAGTVKRLSVAVLVDGAYGLPDADGKRTYEPRTAQQIEQYAALVRSAIGYDDKRGDTVEVVNLRFAANEQQDVEEQPTPLLDLDKNDYFRIGEIIILLVVGIMAILFVVRPILKRILHLIPDPQTLHQQQQAAAQLSDQSGHPRAIESALPPDDSEGGTIDMEQVEGRVRESSLKKVGEIVQKHPEESVSILRNWMFNET